MISELKKLIEKLKGKSVNTKFEKSSIIRQPNAFKSQRPSILGKPTTFSNTLERNDFSKSKSVTQNNVSSDFSKPVTTQTLPQNKKSILKNTNVLAPGMYKLHTQITQTRTSQLPQDSRKTNKRVSFSIGVIPITSVSRPQLKSNPMGDRVKFSKNKTSVTACNDSLKAKTLNVNFMCATCGKGVLNEKHDMCVLKSVNDVNSRTKMPIDVLTLPPNKKSILKNTNLLALGMYKLHTDHTQTRTSQLPQDSKKTNKRVSCYTGVIPTTSVSRPQLKSNPQGDRVMHNNSQGKKQEVEDHHRTVIRTSWTNRNPGRRFYNCPILSNENSQVGNCVVKPIRIIPGPAGIVQTAKLRKLVDIRECGEESVMSTQEYIRKVIEDVGIVTGCFGDVKKFIKNRKLKQIVVVIKSCTSNALGDLTVTLKYLSGTISGTIHYKVLTEERKDHSLAPPAALNCVGTPSPISLPSPFLV
nr:hypothetical protein [Tanacetum cinerariifolium]